MKRFVLGTAALVCAVCVSAQNKAALYDSTQVEALQEIVVTVKVVLIYKVIGLRAEYV